MSVTECLGDDIVHPCCSYFFMIEAGFNQLTVSLKLIPTIIELALRRRRAIPRFRKYPTKSPPGPHISLSFYSFLTSYASSTAKAGQEISPVQV